MSTFTRKWIAGLMAVALVAGVSSWWIARRTGEIAGRARSCDSLAPSPDLGLTADQATGVAALEKTYHARVEELCAKHCAARARIARLLAEDKPPKRHLLSAAKEAGEAYSELEAATVRHVLEVGGLLTPEQRARYHASMSACLGAQCPRAGPMARPSVAP